MFNQIFSGTNGEKIAKYGASALLLLTLFLSVQVLIGLKRFKYVGNEIYPQRTVMASGEGEAFAIPDIASFSFGVVETGKTVAEAQEKADEKIRTALTALKESGIEDKDIKTTNYSFYPQYEWEQVYCIQRVGAVCPPGKNILTGYEVNQTITVKVRETEKAGDLVTRIGTVGASNVSGVEFTVDDREKYVAMARKQAIEKAKANAEELADNLGIRLGKMIYFSENGNYPMPYYAEGMGGAMRDTAVAQNQTKAELPSGESRIVSNISLTYEIK